MDQYPSNITWAPLLEIQVLEIMKVDDGTCRGEGEGVKK